jgi:hypothetical protein
MVPCGGHGNSVYLFVLPRPHLRSSPRKRGPRGHKHIHARLQRAMHSNVAKSPSLGPRFRGDERRMLLPHPFPLFGCQRVVGGRLQKANEIGPCFGFGPGDRPHSSLSSVSLTSRGMARRQGARPGAPGRRLARSTRALGVKRHAPRLAARQRGIFGLRLNQLSGRARSCVSLAGCLPRPPVGQDCVNACPQVAAPAPRSQDAS